MMNEADMVLVEDTQESSYEKKNKKLRKHHREELKQPVVSSDPLSHPSQDTGDSQPSRKKRKKKKSSMEASDSQADNSWVIPETQLSEEPEIDHFVPKKKKKKKKHKHGSDDEFWSSPAPRMSSKLSQKEDLENGSGVKDEEFWTPSMPKKSRKPSKKEDLENGSGVKDEEFWSPLAQKKSRKTSQKENLDNGGGVEDEEFGNLSTPKKSRKLSPKEDLDSGGAVEGDEFGNLSTPKKSRKTSQKENLDNGGGVKDDEFGNLSTPKKSRKLSQKEDLDNGRGVKDDEFGNLSTHKKSRKMSQKENLDSGGGVKDDEFGNLSTHKKSKKTSQKENLDNGGGVEDDEFGNLSTPKKSRKLSQSEDLENGGVVDGNMSSLKKKKKKKKKRKRREDVDLSDALAKEKAEATSSQREDQVDLNETIDTEMDLFASSPLSFSERTQLDFLQGNGQEGSHSPTAADSDATQMDLEMEGTSAGDHEEKQPQSPSELSTSEANTKLDQSQTGRKSRSSRKRAPSETRSTDEERDFSVLNKEQLEDARKELEEFIPRAKTLSDQAIRKLAVRDLLRFREFKKKGVAVKFGVFSQAENDLLQENMEAFLEETGIDMAEKLLFSHRFPEEEAEIKRLKWKHSFCERISRGIARPWRLVYYRARKMFDPQNYNGRYTKKEKKQLFKYHALYGNKWKKISEFMNRSSHSIALKYNQMVEVFDTGPWTEEETKRLLQALRDILRTKVKGLDSALEKRDDEGALTLLRENLYKNISWVKVAAKVETRNWRQCKEKWTSILTKKMAGESYFRGLNNLQFKIDLIKRLYELNVADITEVDWEHIAGVVGNAPPDYVQTRYYRLKSMYVPFWYEKSFPEIIDYLFEETLPSLKKKMKRQLQRRRYPLEEKSCKTSFRFKDIFQDLLEDEQLISEDDSDHEETGEKSQADG
ncbi:transcription termination factor 1 isoform 2-T2 [Vipera latastei]